MNQVLKQNTYTRTYGAAADGVWPEFILETIEDPLATAREGYQCFKEEERVRLHFPADQTKKPVFKVTQEHKDRWPEEYKAFKEGHEVSAKGIPLEQWPVLRKSQVLMLKALSFRTVEDVAAMSDLATQKIGMGGMRLKQLAQGFLDDAASQRLLAVATAESEQLKQTVNEQAEKIANLSQMLERLSADLIALRNAPNPIATYVPGQHDPAEAARQAFPREDVAQSALSDLPAPRRRGKQASSEAAA